MANFTGTAANETILPARFQARSRVIHSVVFLRMLLTLFTVKKATIRLMVAGETT
ncbi:MAG TPA: hypothetical protein PLO50_04160 [Nitrospira sp.]|nr:hypothetical protein [Nitrospira sp.]